MSCKCIALIHLLTHSLTYSLTPLSSWNLTLCYKKEHIKCFRCYVRIALPLANSRIHTHVHMHRWVLIIIMHSSCNTIKKLSPLFSLRMDLITRVPQRLSIYLLHTYICTDIHTVISTRVCHALLCITYTHTKYICRHVRYVCENVLTEVHRIYIHLHKHTYVIGAVAMFSSYSSPRSRLSCQPIHAKGM